MELVICYYLVIFSIWYYLTARKAAKFYIFDISVNPLRVNSWAGLALASMGQLEQTLNSVSFSSTERLFMCSWYIGHVEKMSISRYRY